MINMFNGGWSYTNLEMTALFEHVDVNKQYSNYNILEFGGGDSSGKIFSLFQKNVKDLKYFIFESNENYLPENKDQFNITIYDEKDIEKINLENFIEKDIVFDLVLIDGPNGNKRKYWYNKIKFFVKTGTIILVDDFNHYSCFSEELDKNFEYEMLSWLDTPFEPYGEHSWKIVRVINIKK